ncbi:MAG: menaquinone biosynthesis protein, partial [Ferruginibacter sp.]
CKFAAKIILKQLDRKIRVGAVSYLNTKPLIYGFEKGMMKDRVELVIDYPAHIATKLMNDEIDIGLIPVAIIPELKEYHIISDFCISCDGSVGSVCLFSNVPLHEVETILLDYQSRTSVALLKILLMNHWGISPRLLEGTEGYESTISGTTAGLVIGDRALLQRLQSIYIYDLGLAWKEMTGLPFVFAAWVSNKQLTPEFIVSFNDANKFGLTEIDSVVSENPYAAYNLHKYYTENIKYKPKFDKLEVIRVFLNKLSRISLLA